MWRGSAPTAWVLSDVDKSRYSVGAGEQVVPGALPWPEFGWVELDLPGVVGLPGRDVDEAGPDRHAAGRDVAGSGQVAGGAGKVVRDGGAGQPGVVGVE